MSARPPRPSRGLPGPLPPGEQALWQGAPDAAALARSVFHVRAVLIYFAMLAAVALAFALRGNGSLLPAAATIGGGLVAAGLLRLMAGIAARGTVYTLTDRRIVLRIGMALPTSVNLPLARIAAIDLSDAGDIVLRLAEPSPLGWLALWPHARPWRLARPEPMLRCLADAPAVAREIARACAALDGLGPAIADPGATPAREAIAA